MKPGKWIISYFSVILAMLIIFSAVTYIIDPFMQYRVRDNTYMLNDRFVSAGLIKNYDYDTLMLGSSMTQNFDMEQFRKTLNVKPLHVGIGAMTLHEMNELIDLADEIGRAQKYYICVDLYQYVENDTSSKNPPYLLKSDPLSRLRYSLSYESWFRYMAVDAGMVAMKKLNMNVPASFARKSSIDMLGSWDADAVYGKDITINNFLNGAFAISEVEVTDDLEENMKNNMDVLLEKMAEKPEETVFFFPPYSSLYWCDTQTKGLFEIYMNAKEYFVTSASEYGFKVYDFQGEDFTKDLDNYKDITHYSAKINDWITDKFATEENLVTTENYHEYEKKLRDNAMSFREANSQLF